MFTARTSFYRGDILEDEYNGSIRRNLALVRHEARDGREENKKKKKKKESTIQRMRKGGLERNLFSTVFEFRHEASDYV